MPKYLALVFLMLASMQIKAMDFNEFPDEISINILNFLTEKDLVYISLVSRLFNDFATELIRHKRIYYSTDSYIEDIIGIGDYHKDSEEYLIDNYDYIMQSMVDNFLQKQLNIFNEIIHDKKPRSILILMMTSLMFNVRKIYEPIRKIYKLVLKQRKSTQRYYKDLKCTSVVCQESIKNICSDYHIDCFHILFLSKVSFTDKIYMTKEVKWFIESLYELYASGSNNCTEIAANIANKIKRKYGKKLPDTDRKKIKNNVFKYSELSFFYLASQHNNLQLFKKILNSFYMFIIKQEILIDVRFERRYLEDMLYKIEIASEYFYCIEWCKNIRAVMDESEDIQE